MIHLDYTYALKRKNEGGIKEGELEDVLKELEKINREIQEKPYPFMELPFMSYELEEMKELAASLREKPISDVVLLGIGGSSLGAETLFRAILSPEHNLKHRPRYWVLDNVDPITVSAVIETIEKEKTLLIVVSKSGETPETLSQFMLFKEILEGVKDIKEKIVIITDKKRGLLNRIAEKEGYPSLSVPDGVGGRFSVLSPVGMFPALIMGIEVDEILEGARRMAEHIREKRGEENIAFVLSALLYLTDKKGKKNHVIMPYCDRLSGFSQWFRQLEAESLGKEGKGPTPISSRGVTDQHSQLQLYTEGPKDKFIIFIYVPSQGPIVPQSFPYIHEISYLSGKGLEKLFHSELKGTMFSLVEASVPVSEVWIDSISPYTIGALFYLFEMAIVFFGRLLNVNPFDQPGVEKGKMYTKALMGLEGEESLKKMIAELSREKFTVSF